MSSLDAVRAMIQENELETAVEKLITYLSDINSSKYKKEVMLHAAAITRVKDGMRTQTIPVREANQEQSRICNSILDLLEVIEKKQISKPGIVINSNGKQSPNFKHNQFVLQRLRQLEGILKLQYEKLYEFEKALTLTDGIGQKISIRMQMKHELTPDLRKYEKEYAELLASETLAESIPSGEAETIVAELKDATSDVKKYRDVKAPDIMLSLLEEINQKLNEPGKSAAAKLKVTLPIIPMIASYDLELDTENFLNKVWHKSRNLFQNLVNNKTSK